MVNFIHSLIFAIYPVALITAAVWDARALRIPNRLTLILAMAFLPVAGLAGISMQMIALHIGAGVAAFALLAVLFAFRLLGGGDVKLFAATALWLGWANLAPFTLLVTIVGGVLSLVLLIGRKCVGPSAEGDSWFKRRLNRAHNVPYGIAIAIGGLWLMGRLPVIPGFWPEFWQRLWQGFAYLISL